MTDIHSCIYYCDRPECVKAQRDELRRMASDHRDGRLAAMEKLAALEAELERLRADMEFYRNFAAEVLAVKRLPIPHDMEALCRTAYENRYHKIKADMGYDEWRLVWVRAIATHEAAPQAQPAPPAQPAQRLTDEHRQQLVEVLRGGRQCDEDGVEIIMSRQACREAADIIESAIVPPGYVVVPLEPTPEMIAAGADAAIGCIGTGVCATTATYRAMLAAAGDKP